MWSATRDYIKRCLGIHSGTREIWAFAAHNESFIESASVLSELFSGGSFSVDPQNLSALIAAYTLSFGLFKRGADEGPGIDQLSAYTQEIKCGGANRLFLVDNDKLWQNWQHIKKQRRYFANKGPSSQSYGFSSSHVWMWELGHKEGRTLKNWSFWILVLEKTLESPLDCKEIQPVHPKGDQSWIFIRRTDAEAEAPKLWPPDARSWQVGKDPDAGQDWRRE